MVLSRAALLVLLAGLAGACASPECKHGQASKDGRCLPATASDAGSEPPDHDSGEQDAGSAGDAGEQDDAGGVQCKPGYRETDGKCRNIDECEEHTASCGEHETCVDSDGAYKCDCVEGYTRDPDGHCTQGAMCVVSDANDTDGDGSKCDNCPGVANPSQVDIDADGSGWACDFVTTLPRAFTDAAMKFDGTVQNGDTLDVRVSLAMGPDQALLNYVPTTLLELPPSISLDDQMDPDFAYASGLAGLRTWDYAVQGATTGLAPRLLRDGSLLFSFGPDAGLAIVDGAEQHPFGSQAAYYELIDVADEDLIRITGSPDDQLWRWNKGAPELLLSGAGTITVQTGSEFTNVLTGPDDARSLYRYDASSHSLIQFGTFSTLVTEFSRADRVLYCGEHEGKLSIMSLGALNGTAWEMNDPTLSCSRTRIFADGDRYWFSTQPCAGCARTLNEFGVGTTSLTSTDPGAIDIFHSANATYVRVGAELWSRANDQDAFTRKSVATGAAPNEYSRSTMSDGRLVEVRRTTEGSASQYEVNTLGTDGALTQHSFVADVEALLGATPAGAGMWLALSTYEQSEVLFASDADHADVVLPLAPALLHMIINRAGAALFTRENQLWDTSPNGQLVAIAADTNGKRLLEDWKIDEQPYDLGDGLKGQHILRFHRQDGHYALGAWKDGDIAMPWEDDATLGELARLDSVTSAFSAEDGTRWVHGVSGSTQLLVYFEGATPVIAWRGSAKESALAPFVQTLDDGRVLLVLETQDRAFVWRVESKTLSEWPMEAAPLAKRLSWGPLGLHVTAVSGHDWFCAWSRVDDWNDGACTVLPFSDGEVLGQSSPYQTSAPAGLIVRDAAQNQYLVRVRR